MPKLMQLNNWVIIAAALLVLLIIARYMQHQEPPAMCTESGRSEYRLARGRASTSRGGQLYSEEANALAMDFNGTTVDDGSDADDAILRDRTQYDGRSEQQAKGFSAA